MKGFFACLLAVCLLLTGCGRAELPAPTGPTNVTDPTEPSLPPLTVDTRFESLAQEAVVKTALAFLDRGNRIQYDDTRFSALADQVVNRWEVGLKAPEDYTSQFYGYTNCAAFTYDVYLAALDYNIGAYTTRNLAAKNTKERVYTYLPTGKETKAERDAVEIAFRTELKIGDIIVIRYNGDRDGNGHAMLYVGTDVLGSGQDIIHSTGSNYDYGGYKENFESGGTVRTMSTSSLFSPSSLYVFSNLKSIAIVRPLNTFTREVPLHTQNRIRNLQGVVAEKLCSHTYGMTVNPGDKMTFTFAITNKNDTPVTLDIRDMAPSNTTYLSGAEKVKNGVLSWRLTVPAGEKASVSYEVKVNTNAALGDVIFGENGTVGGVPVKCPKVYIAKTLSVTQQAQIIAAAGQVYDKTGLALAEAIYQKALGKGMGIPVDVAALDAAVYEPFGPPQYRLKGERGMLELVVPGMFGGRNTSQRFEGTDYMRFEGNRTRLPYARDLIPGDIIYAVGREGASGNLAQGLYMVLGDQVLNLNTGKTQSCQSVLNMLLGYARFAILRPSIGIL